MALKTLCLFALVAAFPVPAFAATIVIDASVERVAGEPAVEIVFLNDKTTEFLPPDTLAAEIVQDEIVVRAELRRIGKDVAAVPPGGFSRERYAVTADGAWDAARTFTIRTAYPFAATRAALALPPVGTEEPPVELAAADPPDTRTEPEAPAEATPDRNLNFSPYRPIYALFGTDPINAKIQFGFKYALVDPDGPSAQKFDFLRGIYFGYTQTMFWDLGLPSEPFRSIDFKPELFYRYRSDLAISQAENAIFNVQAGVLHQSNGEDEAESIRFNQFYAEQSVNLSAFGNFRLTVAPRALFYFADEEDNPDIEDFYGHTSLRLTLAEPDGLRVQGFVRGFIGTDRGAGQVDVSHPFSLGFLDELNFRAHAQFFTGFGENLTEFDKRSTEFRIGIGLVQ
ncbi:MAG: phospholipase A [Pseudomonadota bacterium]